jgi:murein DD-endopeptidase MepM/ murein hydrolase activator NlpD
MARLPFPENTITGVYGSMSEFRRKNGLQAHSGTDFAPAGSNRGKTMIPAVANGTIKLIQWSNVLGWVIVQTVWDVKTKKTLYVGYCHISCGKHGVNCKGPKVEGAHVPIQKKVGHVLKEGDDLAIMGNTGSATSGVHLHLTISKTLKGVFGATSAKFDFVEWVKTQGVPAKKTVTPKPIAEKPIVSEKLTIVYACPHCKKELK